MLIDQLPELNSLNDTDEVPVERGTTSYKAKISTWLSKLAGSFVRKIGDTMTGNLTIEKTTPRNILNNDSFTEGTAPSGNATSWVQFGDSAGKEMGDVFHRYSTAKGSTIVIRGKNYNNGSAVNNDLELTVYSDGSRRVAVSDATAWLSALNDGMEYTATAANIATAASECEITTAQYEQWGKVAQLRLVITKTAASTGTVTVATVASEKRPKMNSPATPGYASNLTALIGANGAVQVNGPISAGQSLTILATYMLA